MFEESDITIQQYKSICPDVTTAETGNIVQYLSRYDFDTANELANRIVDSEVKSHYLVLRKQYQNQFKLEEKEWCDRKEKERIHQECVDALFEKFSKDYFAADGYFLKCLSHAISQEEYFDLKVEYIQQWAKKELDKDLDKQQALAVGAVGKSYLVEARAGSGKTRTLVTRALFLHKHCGVPLNTILLLAFNRSAVDQIEKELSKYLGENIPHVMTFHALAYALVHPEETPLFDQEDAGNYRKSYALQEVIDDHIKDPKTGNQIRKFMQAHFQGEWERLAVGGYDKDKNELIRYRQQLFSESMRGESIKSFGEKAIADFLFEHDIPYRYEMNHTWNGMNYRPDFTILRSNKSGIVIEYFGLHGDSDYDSMSSEKRSYWGTKKD